MKENSNNIDNHIICDSTEAGEDYVKKFLQGYKDWQSAGCPKPKYSSSENERLVEEAMTRRLAEYRQEKAQEQTEGVAVRFK